MTERDTRPSVSGLERRTIEAQAVAPFVRAVEKRIGREEARALLVEVNQQEAFKSGKAAAEACGCNGIEQLVKALKGWASEGDMEVEYLEQTETTFSVNVRHCPFVETYKKLGLGDLGVALSCCRDEPFARGFNPRLRLDRTQTIMEGADHCDFRYYLVEDEPEAAGDEGP